MFSALLIDAAGTLIHPAEPVGELYSRHFAANGLALSAETLHEAFQQIFAAAPPPDYAAYECGHEAERQFWLALVRSALESCGPEATAFSHSDAFPPCFDRLFLHYADPAAWDLFPDTLPFLETAAGLARLAVVSNFDQRLLPILDGHGLSPFFELIHTSGHAKSSKPDPAIFHQTLDLLGLETADVAHVGDSREADLAGAQAAGIRAFHLRRPTLTLLDFLDFCQSGTESSAGGTPRR